VHTGTRVTDVLEQGGSAAVATADRRRFECDVVVLCAGPHSLGLLAHPCPVAAPPSSPQVAYFRPKRGNDEAALPVFIEWGEHMLYGLPVHRGAEHGGTYKVSHHTPGTPLEHHRVAHGEPPVPDDAALLARVTDAVRRLLPTLDPEPVATERCVYDNSADGDFVLDRSGRVVVGCASSGHGFKFGPLIGEILADLAEEAPPAVDLSPFRLDRRRAN